MAKRPVYPDSFVRHDIVASEVNEARPGPADLVVFASGPAGVSTLTVADGIEVSVDYANPSQLCLAALAADVDRRSLAALIGDLRLDRALRPNEGRPSRVEGLGDGPTPSRLGPVECRPTHFPMRPPNASAGWWPSPTSPPIQPRAT